MFRRLARKTAEALMPPLASRSRRNPPYGTTFDQLDALDEASLLALWDKYAVIVSHFEPTKRWEEAALVFSFIQAKRWKNQLFNYSWSAQVHPGAASQPVAEPDFFLDPPTGRPAPAKPKRKAAIIQFRPHRSPEKDASEEPGGKG